MHNVKPEILSLRQHASGRLSRGDAASVALHLGDLQWLERLAGADSGARFSRPLLAAAAAIDALLDAAESQSEWQPAHLAIEWLSTDNRNKRITATATLVKHDKERIKFRVEGRSEDAILYRGYIEFSNCSQRRDGELFRVLKAPRAISLGATGVIRLDFKTNAHFEVRLPCGRGLRLVSSPSLHVPSGPLALEVIADRPHEVNLGSPWTILLSAGKGEVKQTVEFKIEVPDPEPGRIFYILTEDCETFDGGPLTGNYGPSEVFGNHNNFMDPQDYLVQMVEKPSRMNEIADKVGARWTHFWAAPQRFGAEWAHSQSSTGAWEQVIEAMDASIRAGSVRHEYAPHLHCDYEPASSLPPQPRLVYDSATDGILPNDYYDPVDNPTHKYHDWDGAARGGPGIKALGSWDDVNSKAGSLFKSLNYVSRQQADSRHTLIGRTGSYDFGGNANDQEISTQAYETLGLRANSDARITTEETIPGGHLFWCRRDDRLQRIASLEDAALVQLAVTRDFSFHVIDDVNGWFEKHWPSCQGKGVHALSLMTHAMFMRGVPDAFTSLTGGSFAVLEQHLAWVRDHYPRSEFATATEAVTEFLDYYSPNLIAIVDPRLIGGDPAQGRFLFSVRLLGKGIHVDAEHPAQVRFIAPALFQPSVVREVTVRQGSTVLGRASGHELTIVMDTRDEPLTFEVLAEDAAALFGTAPLYHDPPDKRHPDLLDLSSQPPHTACGRALALLGEALSKHIQLPAAERLDFESAAPKPLGARLRAAIRTILK